MTERRKIEERLKRKQQEILALEEQIKDARVYVQALQDVLKILPKAPDPTVSADAVLRPGSAVAMTREIILSKNQPVHISDILQALGKDITRETRASLTSSLAAYVRRGEIFTRPAPNTFGLIELGHLSREDAKTDEPPTGFGEVTPLPPKTKEDDEDIPF